MDTLAVLSLKGATGLADDQYVTNFAITDVPDHAGGTNVGIVGALYNFITEVPTGGLAAIQDFISSVVPRTPALSMQAKLYDITGHLDGSPHGSPYYVHPGAVLDDSAGGFALPSEVACCVTLEALGRAAAQVEVADDGDAGPERNRPKQRLTGRIFLGPLDNGAIEYTGFVPRVSNALRDTVRLAVKDLRQAIFLNAGGADLGVWSRKNATIVPLEAVSIDDAFDTVRSRGEKPTLRERTLI